MLCAVKNGVDRTIRQPANRRLREPAIAYPCSQRICDLPQRERPRELMERVGAEQVSDAVLLSILLRSGVPGASALQVGQALLERYGTLFRLTQASVIELASLKGMGPVRAQVVKAALELGRRLAEEGEARPEKVSEPEAAAGVLRRKIKFREEESFWVLLLDTRNCLKQPPVEVTRGILDASLVHPREVFREAVRSAAAAVIVGHNHPSGDTTPSAEDLRITRQLIESSKIVDIPLLDHIIIGNAKSMQEQAWLSLREQGLLAF